MKSKRPSSPDNDPQPERPDPGREPHSAPSGAGDLWDFNYTSHNASPPEKDSPPENTPMPPEDASPPAAITPSPRGRQRNSLPFKPTAAKDKDLSKAEDLPPENNSNESKRPGRPASAERQPVKDTFDELEDSLSDIPIPPPAPSSPPEPSPASAPQSDSDSTPSAETTSSPEEEPAPLQPKAANEPKKSLTKGEKIGLAVFLVLILAGGLFFIANSVGKLPEETKTLTIGDFPIKGSRVEAISFKSYWRDPVTTGPDADTVRRGTIILPVVELGVSGGPAAIRIFYRNSDGATVGDAVTHAVNGKATLILPATAGFEEPGMHAAYRTGDAKPWIVEVFEGPSANAAGSDFKKLFEIPVSTHRR